MNRLCEEAEHEKQINNLLQAMEVEPTKLQKIIGITPAWLRRKGRWVDCRHTFCFPVPA